MSPVPKLSTVKSPSQGEDPAPGWQRERVRPPRLAAREFDPAGQTAVEQRGDHSQDAIGDKHGAEGGEFSESESALQQGRHSGGERPEGARDGASDAAQGEEIRAPLRCHRDGQDGLFERTRPASPNEPAEVPHEGGDEQDGEALAHDEHDPGERHEAAQGHEGPASPNGVAQHPRHDGGERRPHCADS